MRIFRIISLVLISLGICCQAYSEDKASENKTEEAMGALKIFESDGGRPFNNEESVQFVVPTPAMKGYVESELPEMSFREIPSCMESTKLTEKMVSKSSTGELMADYLFLKKGTLPEDWKIIVGSDVVPFELDGTNTPFNSMMADTLKIPCIPYRVRAFDDKVDKFSGHQAFKNFDESKGGKLHKYYKE